MAFRFVIVHMYVCTCSTAKGASRSRGILQTDGNLQQRGEGECFKMSFVESKFDLVVLCWWATCFVLLTWLPSLHSLCLRMFPHAVHAVCSRVFPHDVCAAKAGSGKWCAYVSVTTYVRMYQNGLCYAYCTSWTTLAWNLADGCSVLSWVARYDSCHLFVNFP